jgi:hypothetical protein
LPEEIPMFGWLATHSRSACRLAAPTVQRRWLRVAPPLLAECLPLLGDVLYVSGAGTCVPPDMPPGWLAARCELSPLLQMHWLAVAGHVGDDGPCEWLECLDRHGRLRARLHLLPDTDYLAWDALPAIGVPDVPPLRRDWPPFRPAWACTLRLRLRRLAGLAVLDAAAPGPLSDLGRDLAGRIARAEAVPLHSVPAG